MTRRPVAVAALSLCLALQLSAATSRHRASKNPAPPPDTPSGAACQSVPLPRTGTVAQYFQTVLVDPLNIHPTSTFTYTYVESSSTKLVQNIKTTSSSSAGSLGTTESNVTLNYTTVGNLLSVASGKIDLTLSFAGAGSVNAVFDMKFTPAYPAQPASQWCAGSTWAMPASTWDINVTAQGQSQTLPPLQIPGGSAGVLARETITVPAGTFDTFKYTDFMDAALQTAFAGTPSASFTYTTAWVDVKTGVVVRWEQRDPASGQVTARTDLTSLR